AAAALLPLRLRVPCVLRDLPSLPTRRSSDLEALCDRVAILREGELLEQGTLVELRHLSALDVEATFDGPPPDVSTVPGVVSSERSEEHTSELQSRVDLVCRLLLEKKNKDMAN